MILPRRHQVAKNHKENIYNAFSFVHLSAFVPLWLIIKLVLIGFLPVSRWCNQNAIIADLKSAYNKCRIANHKQLIFYSKRISIYAFSIVLLTLASSCSVVGYKAVSNSNDNNIATIQIFDDNFEKALYKTDINIYSTNLTGITIIKKKDSAMRVVSMSELGMKYFDFEFHNNQQKDPVVHYIMASLNKNLLVNMIKKDFGLLFYLPKINESKVMVNVEDKSKILIKNNKLLYLSDTMGTISIIKKYRVLLPNKTIITLSKTAQSYPDTIEINHGKISLNFVNLK